MLGMLGLGYLYTNKDTVSIGIGVGLDELAKHKLKPYELLDQLKEHPSIKNYLKDGELVEYCAHLILKADTKNPKTFRSRRNAYRRLRYVCKQRSLGRHKFGYD